MKKTKLMIMSSLLMIGLTACGVGGKTDPTKPVTPSVTPTIPSGKVFNIGISQLVNHPALDAATEGFMAAVKEGLGEEHVKFDLQNAAGDSSTCVTIANSFVSKKVDLIMANATPALQAAANSTLTIPVLGTSITEYGVALSIDDFDGVVGGNVSGTSDLAPLGEQAAMVKEVFPNAKKVGLFYCSSEANSIYQVKTVKEELIKLGLQTEEFSFTDSNDIQSVLQGHVKGLDVLYIPTDNACASNAEIIDSICSKENLPVVAGEENLCKGCGAITLSISYENIGKKTGEMAVNILKNHADISKMAIQYDANPVKKFNKEICERLGITVPASYTAIE